MVNLCLRSRIMFWTDGGGYKEKTEKKAGRDGSEYMAEKRRTARHCFERRDSFDQSFLTVHAGLLNAGNLWMERFFIFGF